MHSIEQLIQRAKARQLNKINIEPRSRAEFQIQSSYIILVITRLSKDVVRPLLWIIKRWMKRKHSYKQQKNGSDLMHFPRHSDSWANRNATDGKHPIWYVDGGSDRQAACYSVGTGHKI